MNNNRIESTMMMDGLHYLYKHPEDDGIVFRVTSPEKKFLHASIEDLRKDIEEQVENLARGLDKYGKEIIEDQIFPWEGILVCREGFFTWCQGDYVSITLELSK